MKRIGFDNSKYLKLQKKAILERIERFDGKLYLEFGGKLFFDYHASRVLPGYNPNSKMLLLQSLKNDMDFILCVSAKSLESNKMAGDLGLSYDANLLKMIDDLAKWGMKTTAVVITHFQNQPGAKILKNMLSRRKVKVYLHKIIKGYPNNIKNILSKNGFGANEYIKTENRLVVVAAPGPGSGKLATCLSQLYHDYKNGVRSGYAKFETFPVWNLPLNHPVNIAYEAATADLGDKNMIDKYHLKSYKIKAVNYNRDLEAFAILKRILKKIMKKDFIYKSPTDMGVNQVGFCITNDDVVSEACRQELVRRYFRYHCEYAIGVQNQETIKRIDLLIKKMKVKIGERKVVIPARKAALEAKKTKGKGNEGIYCGVALELPSGKIITGKNSPLMHSASSVILNAIKELAGIPDRVKLLSPEVLESIGEFKKKVLGVSNVSLNLEETLIALSICAASDKLAKKAMEKLGYLKDCEMHITHMATGGDLNALHKLQINLTCDPNFSSKNLLI